MVRSGNKTHAALIGDAHGVLELLWLILMTLLASARPPGPRGAPHRHELDPCRRQEG
jgi:hypothetical protein